MGAKKKTKKKSKPRAPKKTFQDRLAEKMFEFADAINKCKVESDRFNDNSGNWVSIEVNGIHLTISISPDGERITNIELHKDIIDVVSQEKVWGIKP